MACLEQSVALGQRVVEDRIVGEVAHGKIVDPSQRTGVGTPIRIDPENGEMAREHALMLQPRQEKWRPR